MSEVAINKDSPMITFLFSIYLLAGFCAGLAQYIIDDADRWKLAPVMLLWPIALLVCFFLIVFKKADE